MKRVKGIKPALAAAAVVLLLAGQAGPVLAETLPGRQVTAPVQASETVNPDGTLTLKGTLEYSDLEGGFYSVGGWAILGDESVLAGYVGQEVEVQGTRFEGMSIRMVKELVMTEIKAQESTGSQADPSLAEKPAPSMRPAVDDQGRMTLEGVVEYELVETPHYVVAGWELRGDRALFESLVGQHVIVRGTEFTGMSTQMTSQIDVESLSTRLKADRTMPGQVTVAGQTVTFDQGPVVMDGILMLPLRFVVEAAGGKVEWNAQERSVLVTLSDRTAYFVIGQSEAEMNENGARYLRRNLLPMSHAAVIQGDRTLIPADSVSQILGLVERYDTDANLDLLPLK